MYKIGLVLMAAGGATRFNSNKLMAQVNGCTLFERALNVIPVDEFYKVLVVTQYEKLKAQARERGFRVIMNELPEFGLSYTIGLGISKLEAADAIMFMVADQPFLKRQSIKNAVAIHRANVGHIVAMAFNDRLGNPCIFPREFYPQLYALEGDHGGRTIIERNPDRVLLCHVQDGRELTDVDTAEQLEQLIR